MFGFAVNALSNIGNMFSNSENNKSNQKFQSEQNQIDRDFQREMAEYAYQQNLAQWQRENEYNSPAQVMSRLKEAGLNPDLIYGGGAGNLTAASSPQMQGSVGSHGVTPSSVPSTVNSDSLNQAMLTDAQIDVLRSQADKNRADAGKATTEESVVKDLAENTIRVGDATISMNKSLSEQLQANTKMIRDTVVPTVQKLEAEIDLLKQQKVESQERVYNIRADTAIKRLEAAFQRGTLDIRIKQIAATYRKTEAEIRACVGYLAISNLLAPEQLGILQNTRNNLKWDSWIKKSELNGIRIHNNQMLFDLESDKDFKNWERGIHMFTDVVSTSVDAYTTFRGGFNLHSRDFFDWKR